MKQRANHKKRVLLLNPYSDEYSDIKKQDSSAIDEGRLFVETPLGILYVYTYARENLPDICFFIMDAQAMLIEKIEKGLEYNWRYLMDKIIEIDPDVIGIGAYYFQSANLFHQTCQRIRAILQDVLIVAGGNYPTDAQEKILTDPNVDYIIISEGEQSFVNLLKGYYSGLGISAVAGVGFQAEDGLFQVNPQQYIPDLAAIPIPDRSVLPMHIYGRGRNMLDRIFGAKKYRALSMTVSRGCPFACKFCSAKSFWGRKIRYRDTTSVLDEMQMLKEKYGATVVVINDDNFLLDKAKASAVMQGMIDRKLNLQWYAGGGTAVRAFLDEAFLDLAVQSGYCCFNLAIESSSDATLKRVAKPVRVGEVRTLVNRIRTKYPQLWIAGYFIIGFPFETKQDIINTFEFSRELELDWCSYSVFKLLPQTELYDEYIDLIRAAEVSRDGEVLTAKAGSSFEKHYEYSSDIINVDGRDWDRAWLFDKQYEYNLLVNFLESPNIKYGNYEQALRDFEYVINIAPRHAIAYKQASLAAAKIGKALLAEQYAAKEHEIMTSDNEFTAWYEKFSLAV